MFKFLYYVIICIGDNKMEGMIFYFFSLTLTPIILDKIRLYKVSKYDGCIINK